MLVSLDNSQHTSPSISGFVRRLFQVRERHAYRFPKRRRTMGQSVEECESRILLTTPLFINEFHYDDTGTDSNEFIEIAGPAGTDLDGFSIFLYDGSSGSTYKELVLTGTIPDQDDGVGTLSFLQEGILDTNGGFALVDDNSNVLQFLSYEGSFTATSGPAQSLMSTDVGLDEDPAVSEGLSLQLQGLGGCFEDFVWGLVSETPGAKNNGQNLYPCEAPATITVTTAVDENDGHIDSNTGAGVSLREAIIAANENPDLNTIIFDVSLNGSPILLTIPQTNEDLSVDGDLDITSPITIIGNGTANTSIDAGADVDDITNTPGLQERVFHVLGTGNLTLQDLTVTGGNDGGGAGIFVANNGTLGITDSTITGNRAIGAGGGISAFSSSNVTISNSTISYNDASSGGGIFANGTMTITGSTIDFNEVTGNGGGIIVNPNGNVTIQQSVLDQNDSGDNGGGVHVSSGGDLDIELSTLSGNTAVDFGGGISASTSANVILRTSTVDGNNSQYGGGLFSEGNVLVRDSTISGNTASNSGGGILFYDGTGDVINSTISGNSASDFGGGIYNEQATVTLRNSTITLNMATNNGGGIELFSANSGDNFTLHNTIVAGNLSMGAVPSDIHGDNVNAASASNIIGDASSTGGLINLVAGNQIGHALSSIIDPTLMDNGGPTFTHATVLSSIAIDAGNNLQALDENNVPLTTDQRGHTRRKSDRVDIGAFEGTQTDITVTTANDVVNQFDAKVSLREAIIAANGDTHANTIHFSAVLNGVPIILTILGTGDDESLSGDLDVTSDLTIMGNGRTNTIIDGGADIDDIGNTPGIGEAVFHVLGGVTFQVEQVKITGGNRVASFGQNVNGGGVYSPDGHLTIVNSEISENLGYRGGGVSVDVSLNSSLTVNNSTISNNQAHTGGGIYSSSGMTLISSKVSHNVSSAIGGGIYSRAFLTPIEIRQTTISENMAGSTAGGILIDEGLIIDSTISENISQSSGGGVYLSGDEADLTIINSTISENSANFNAGGIGLITSDPQQLKLVNSTIYGNSATTGGGIRLSSASNVMMDNTIVAGSEGGADIQIYAGTALTGTHNLIEDGLNLGSLTNTITGSPMLGQLADNGGPTFTHAPKPNSPVLNRGNNTKAVDENMVALVNDQRGSGFDRIITRVDIGAFEGFIDPYSSIVGFTNGNWWLTAADGAGVYDTAVAASGPASSFQKVLTGDFNGDGIDDLACWLNNGDWRVGIADGNGNFTFSTWTSWTHPNIKEIHVGDFNNDGLDDIIGLFKLPTNNRGRWWVGMSNGTQFLNRDWGDFGNYTGIAEVLVGNFDGVKGDDLSIITATGNVFMVKTSNTQFQYLFSHNWNINNGFNFVQAGDFNGDGRDDIVAVFGTTSNRGIFVAKSTGPATGFASLKFADITASQSFDSLVIGDFNGDGKDDVAARLNTTKWWVGLADINVFNFSFWTTWSFATNGISDVHAGSTNRDNMSDILGRASDGNWYTAESSGTSFSNRVIDAWSSTAAWQYVQGGADFNQPAAPSNPAPAPSASPSISAFTNELNSSRWSIPIPDSEWLPTDESPETEKSVTVKIESEEANDFDTFGDQDLLNLLYSLPL